MNLIDSGFQHSNLFEHLPVFDEITYAGLNQWKVREYQAIREGQVCKILALSFIRKDEKMLWDAVEDFLKRSTANAVAAVRGVHVFDLLTVDIHKEIKTFNHAELSAVIVNTSRKMAPGTRSMIKYSSVYALLHKATTEDWGKISFKSAVDVFKDKPEYLDIYIDLLLRDFQFPHDPVVLILNDLSQNPVFDGRNAAQQERLKKVIARLIPVSIEFIPEVYIQDKNGARELLSGTQL
jgi:hypothetical protein